jgi:hypothetical protein
VGAIAFRPPDLASAGIKAERGFTGEAYAAREDTFIVDIIALLEGTPLKAGEETPVAVDVPNLPLNANITKITASLTVLYDGQTGTAPTTAVGITEGKETRNFQVSVSAVSALRNVQVRLNKGAIFWTRADATPADSPYSIPDFSAQANAYLDKYDSKNGKVTLQFMVKSDVAGRVLINIDDGLAYSLLQTQHWKNDLDSTFRVDRTLKLTFNQVQQLPIEAVPQPTGRQAVVTHIRLDAGGQFGADRLLGSVETHDGHQFATVSQDFSLAQQATPVKDLLKTAIQCTGVAGYFESGDPANSKAEFYVEMQADENGSPAGGAPLAKSNVAFTPADKKDPQPWTFAKFEKPAELKPDTPYWIVVKGVHGAVKLGLKTAGASEGAASVPSPVERGPLLLNRGGLIWKAFTASLLHALLSLVYAPQSDNQTAAVEISVGGGASQRLDPQGAAKTVSFPVTGSGAPLLLVDSRALGSLTIANVIQEYMLV